MSAGFRVMGILNVTPDSFSDGGHYLDASAAIEHGLAMAADGADIIDVGGESTRPGSEPVSAGEELERVVPVIEGLLAARAGAAISIDTSKLEVAAAALDAGASFVNDVTALRAPGMAELVAARGAECCLVHMRGDPLTMQDDPRYRDVVGEVAAFLREREAAAVAAGVARERILVDPGIGFGKTVEHNLELLDRLGELEGIGHGILIGTSRKSFLGALAGERKRDRLAGTIATNVIALLRGASVFRVHDVAAVRDALDVAAATVRVR
ncbi:MAG TPA: dihydropteroate synthase [Solirubrobacteraceae bacterium]|nr:dihydropteroate synthase [Solirubrobacteraceae bacterium]